MKSTMPKFAAAVAAFTMILSAYVAGAQTRLPAYDTRINPVLLNPRGNGMDGNDGRWDASWITGEGSDNSYGVYLFRKALDLSAVPGSFIINVSADNRYKLYVNGSYVCNGPAKGDVENWNFDTVDIAPWLHAGRNAVCAVVWNFADKKPVAIMSLGNPGFLVQGNSDEESSMNTGRGWKALRCAAYSPEPVKVRGYYAAGCCDRLDAGLFPWGWEKEDFDDSEWKAAQKITRAAPKGARDYPAWQLVPRPIPMMAEKEIGSNNIEDLTVPAWTTAEVLVDAKALTTGYPRLTVSGGCGAEVSMSYAESLFEGPGHEKGDRRVTEGKEFIGMSDVLVADGGDDRVLEPLWWRTWRYIKVTVKTVGSPLTINSMTARLSMYPFSKESEFYAKGMPDLNRMLQIGWHTARLCAHETYMDCPYYEQLQYFGDSRIQALVTMFNTRDSCMVRNLIEQGRRSMSADGIMMSRYPSNVIQFIPPYALFWINTCHDWWMYRGDEEYLKTLLPSMRSVLGWFGEYLGGDGCLHNVPGWNFCDYADGVNQGVMPEDAQGRSAYLDLEYILALRDAARMERSFGIGELAHKYEAAARKAAEAVKAYAWDEGRRMFADNGAKDSFSQEINSLAILADLVDSKEASELFRRINDDKSLTQCTIYFRYYLQQAMARSGNGNMFIDGLDVLRRQMDLGLTTWAEKPEPARSDCHAWGASPNIEMFRMVLGIDSAAPGFRKVRIAPSPCGLKEFSGSIPHPHGTVSVSYEVSDNGRIRAQITLPEGVDGTFVWNGRSHALKGGKNAVSAK